MTKGMKAIVKVGEKRAVLDTNTDICLYYAQRGLDPSHRDGVDIYLHITKNGLKVFYNFEWSLYQNIPDSIELITEKKAREELEARISRMSKNEIERVLNIFPDFLEETA